MLLESLAQLVMDPTLGSIGALPLSAIMGLMGGAVGYGMVKGKVDATQVELRAMETRIEKRLERVENQLDELLLRRRD